MRAATLPSAGAPGFSAPGLLVPLVAFAGIAAMVGDDSVEVTMAVLVLAALLWWTWKAPPAVSVLVLMFVGLVLETPDQRSAGGGWQSPLSTLGAVMLAHLNVTTGVKALFFSGIDLMMAMIFLVILAKTLTRAADAESGPAGSPIRSVAWLSLLGTLAWWSYGLEQGGSTSGSLWQANKLYYLPLAVLLFETAFRGLKDSRPLARVLILAACVKAGLAVWVAFVVIQGEVAYATTHADSILFACAISFIVALYVEERGRVRRSLYLLALPLILAGMVANNRRLAWVGVAWALSTFYLVMPWSRRKRTVTRWMLLSLPLVAVYLAVGWKSPSTVFAPARLVASVVSSDADGSTRWRDMENFNLVYNVGQNPLFGTGFGHEYIERVQLPDVSAAFPMYRFQPHNGVLALWAFCGYIGFCVQWLLLVVGVFLAARTYRYAGRPLDRAAALGCVAAIVIYMIAAYGDTTLGSWSAVFTVAPALGLSANLAVTTGAWPAARRPAAAAPERPS